jgi:hemoglobin
VLQLKAMKRTDINTRTDIHLLVSSFYQKVKKDDLLSPFFKDKITDWDKHIDHLTDFWESSLFLKTKFNGDPLEKHIEVDKNHNNSITELHFGVWLNLWLQTIDELFEGDFAENAKRRARKMGTFIYLKIFEARQKM